MYHLPIHLLILSWATVVPEVTSIEQMARFYKNHNGHHGDHSNYRIVHLRSTPENTWKLSQIVQLEWDADFNWYAEAYKRLQNSKTASLKDSTLKAIEKSEKTRQMWLQQLFFFTWILSPNPNWTAFPLWRDQTKNIHQVGFKTATAPRPDN